MVEGKYETQKNFGRDNGKQTQKETMCKESGERSNRRYGTARRQARKDKPSSSYFDDWPTDTSANAMCQPPTSEERMAKK
jgi:hypothetical protein